MYVVRNVRKFTKFSCYKGNVKFDDIYNLFEQRYLKIAKNVLDFLQFSEYYETQLIVHEMYQLPKT